MCSINFSNTGSDFRSQVSKAASNQVISQEEISGLGKIAETDTEKNFVKNLESKANFHDLKVSSFDPVNASITLDFIEDSVPTARPEREPAAPARTHQPENIPSPETGSQRSYSIVPLMAALAMLIGGLSGAASNEELYVAVDKSLQEALNSQSKPGQNSVENKEEGEPDPVSKHKKMLEGK